MPSLKDYLESVCQSAYKRSLPSNEFVDVQLTQANETHVAPFDGHVECIVSNIPNVESINLGDGQSLVSLIPCYLNAWGSVWIPCKKGILLQLVSRVLADRHFDLYSRGTAQANIRLQGGAL